jgi:CubicO group peptidase (beta-lactamase class C family)
MQSQDWVSEILRNPESPPGGGFGYSNASAHLVSILQHATGITALAYARSRLFGPLGFRTRPAMTGVVTFADLDPWRTADFAWPEDPQGISTGRWGLGLRPLDMVELGQLDLADGRWHGEAGRAGRVGQGGHLATGRCFGIRRWLRLPLVDSRERLVTGLPRLGVRRAAHRGGPRSRPRRGDHHRGPARRPREPRCRLRRTPRDDPPRDHLPIPSGIGRTVWSGNRQMQPVIVGARRLRSLRSPPEPWLTATRGD